MSRIGRTIANVAQLAGAMVLLKDYVAEAALCKGDSMLPTLRSEGDVVLVEKISTPLRALKRGDVVVCVSPSDPEKLICKRLIALVCERRRVCNL